MVLEGSGLCVCFFFFLCMVCVGLWDWQPLKNRMVVGGRTNRSGVNGRYVVQELNWKSVTPGGTASFFRDQSKDACRTACDLAYSTCLACLHRKPACRPKGLRTPSSRSAWGALMGPGCGIGTRGWSKWSTPCGNLRRKMRMEILLYIIFTRLPPAAADPQGIEP